MNKTTLVDYIIHLKGVYKQYGNISISKLKYIEKSRKNKQKKWINNE